MASRTRKNKKPGRGGKIALGLFAGIAALLLALTGVAALRANRVQVRRARAAVADLPPAFEGKTLLYASDIDLCGLNTPSKAAALFRQLQSLNPDILLLGGDYTSESVLDILNRSGDRASDAADSLRARADFFHYISDFYAPLGKFAIAAPEDPEQNALRQLMTDSGIQPLFNDRAAISIGGDTLWITGVSDAGLGSIGSGFQRSDCVVAAAWSPSAFPTMVTNEAAGGGQWADLVLSGHTHGGQIRLFGRSVLPLERMEQQYLSGWRVENGVPILVSTGVGCEGANLRLGTSAEVWLITLTSKPTETTE